MQPGDLAFDRFEIEGIAGAGGMGVVYRARDRVSGERVALKIMQGMAKDRFQREAILLSEIAHPCIVRYLAHGDTWLAMEWLEGEDLEQRLLHTPLTTAESVVLAAAVAAALGVAHRRGVIHRDVKPANIWLVGGDPAYVKLLDFGIARAVAKMSLTAAGSVIGTPAYMAPEQACGSRALDARADIFSLGCVLYECLASRAPFVGETMAAVLAKVLLEDVMPLGQGALERLVARMIEKDPNARPSDGTTVAAELLAIDLTTLAVRDGASKGPLVLGRIEQKLASVVLIERKEDVAQTIEAGPISAGIIEGGALAIYRRTAAEHGGRVEALRDGTIVVALEGKGAPTDQARTAATCALALAGAVPGAKLALATGRATGLVGEAIDRAAHLVAAPKSERGVRLDHVTVGLLDSRFEIDGDASGLYVVSLRERREAVRTLLGKPTPCVGRDADLMMLESAVTRSFDDDSSGAAIVTAPAGVGKTRVCHELLERLRNKTQVWMGRGDSMKPGSFVLCAEMVRAQAGIQAGEPLAARREKLRARVMRHIPTDDAQRVTHFLGEMIGTDFPTNDLLDSARCDPTTMGDQIRRAWVDFCEAESSSGPLLLVLDDLHWADPGTVECVKIALDVCREKPLFVIAFARPEIEEQFPKLWKSRDPLLLRLGKLARKQAEKLVRGVLGDATESVVTRVVDQADGNAFLLEELLRAAADGKTEVPQTVLGMVESRMSELDPEARRVLRAASVFGQTFWKGAVAALLGASQVGMLLDVLERDEWVNARTESSVHADTEYGFRHALVREGAYAMLTDEDRLLGHKLAGEWLEAHAVTAAAAIAEHFEKGGERPRAAEIWARAAEEALEANALEAAVACVGRGASCGAEGELLGRLRLAEAEARNWRGEIAQSLTAAETASSLFPEGSDRWAEAMLWSSLEAFRLGQRDRAVDMCRRLANAKTSSFAELATARLTVNLYLYGLREEAEVLMERAEAIGRTRSDPAFRCAVYQARAFRALMLGDTGSYAEIAESAAEAFYIAGNARRACVMRSNVGFALIELGLYDDAEKRLRASLVEAERMGLTAVRPSTLLNLGLARASKGALAEAAALQEEAIQLFEEQGDQRLLGSSRADRAHLALAIGDLPRAERDAKSAAKLLEAVPPLRAYALATLADAFRQKNDPATLTTAREAKECLDAHGTEQNEAYIRRICAEIEQTLGDPNAAREQFSVARRRLLERAEKISSPVARASFLERVPEHVRALAFADG